MSIPESLRGPRGAEGDDVEVVVVLVVVILVGVLEGDSVAEEEEEEGEAEEEVLVGEECRVLSCTATGRFSQLLLRTYINSLDMNWSRGR